ncbi:MAG: hypothetical protein AAF957_25630 [Planctomycetota bacterium]
MRHLPFQLSIVLFLVSTLAAACGARSQDASRFHGAVTLDDGRTGLVSYQRARSAQVESTGSFLAFGGAIWGNARDRKVLATIDLESGAVDVVFRDERPRPGIGGDYRIRGVAGRKVLLLRTEWRDPRAGGREVQAAWLLFDLDTREMVPVDTRAELEAMGRSSEAAGLLVHRSGVLLGLCSRADGDPEEWESALYLRAPDGSYRFRGNERAGYIGRDVMLTYDKVRRVSREVDSVTGEARELSLVEFGARRKAITDAEKARRADAPGLYIDGKGTRVLSSNGEPPPRRETRTVAIDVDRLR